MRVPIRCALVVCLGLAIWLPISQGQASTTTSTSNWRAQFSHIVHQMLHIDQSLFPCGGKSSCGTLPLPKKAHFKQLYQSRVAVEQLLLLTDQAFPRIASTQTVVIYKLITKAGHFLVTYSRVSVRLERRSNDQLPNRVVHMSLINPAAFDLRRALAMLQQSN